MTALWVMRGLCLLMPALLPWMEGGGSASGLLVAHTIVLASAAVAVGVAWRRRPVPGGGIDTFLLLAIPVCALISWARVDARYGSALALLDLTAPFVLALSLRAVPEPRGESWVGLRAVTAAASAVQAATIFLLPADPTLTPSAGFPNANQLAAWLVIGMLLSLGLCARWLRAPDGPGRGAAIAAAGIAAIDLAALIRIGSRAAFLALVVVAAVSVIRIPRDRRALRRAILAVVILLVIGGLSATIRRFDRMEDPYRWDRVRIWQAGLRAGIDHPVIGMGPGMFERRGYRYNFPLDREMFRYAKTPTTPHSTWIAAFADLGLAGLAASLLLAGAACARGGRAPRDGTYAALIACLVMACFDEPFASPAVALTLTALLVPILASRTAAGPAPPSGGCPPRRRIVAQAAILILWIRVVAIPFAAHAIYARGVDRPDGDRLLAVAAAIEPYNPLYPAARADRIRSQPLTLPSFAQAHNLLGEARHLDPGATAWAFSLAQLHARASFAIGADAPQVARTIALYRDTIALGRKDPRPHAELGAYLMAFGRPEEGIARFREAIALEPRFLGAGLSLARALLETGRRQEGKEAFEAFERARGDLEGYRPKNRYEEDLMRHEAGAADRIRSLLAPPL